MMRSTASPGGSAASPSDASDRVIDVDRHRHHGVEVDVSSGDLEDSDHDHDEDAAYAHVQGNDSTDPEQTPDEEQDHESDAHARRYRRGRMKLPMQSPADSDPDPSAARRPRGARSRRRFFKDSADESVEVTATAPRGRILQRITLRRRRRGELDKDDAFWTSIWISNVVSVVLMLSLVIYFAQSDFFESHQNDLLGTTVDNRFTVVSPENTRARIYLKSGYARDMFSEAMLAFGNGELRIGRRKSVTKDTQDFYGVSLMANGSAVFTNRVTAPNMKTDYLFATKAVVFDDGTVMTTAANMSGGGIKELGDLNLVSKSGAITMSSRGDSIMQIDPRTGVTVHNTSLDDPASSVGIRLNGAIGEVSISDGLRLRHDANTSTISSAHTLSMNTSTMRLGSADSAFATLTCADSRALTLRISGQDQPKKSIGGGIEVAGGGGATRGGDVFIAGGECTKDDSDAYGSVLINAQLAKDGSSLTEIGSHGPSHAVKLHGAVSINTESTSASKVSIGGAQVAMHPKIFKVDNVAINESSVELKSSELILRAYGESEDTPTASIHLTDTSVVVDADQAVLIGKKAVRTVIGDRHTSSSVVVNDDKITLNSTGNIELINGGSNTSTWLPGRVVMGDDDEVPDMTVAHGIIAMDPAVFSIGKEGDTKSASVYAQHLKLGSNALNTSINVTGDAFLVDCHDIKLGTDVDRVGIGGDAISISAKTGEPADKKVIVDATTVVVAGGDVTIGNEKTHAVHVGNTNVPEVAIDAKTAKLGTSASSISIGSASATIDIKGTITLNGQPLQTRRELSSLDRVYAYLSAGHVALSFPTVDRNAPIVFEETYSSNQAHLQVDKTFGLVTNNQLSAHMQISLSMDNIRARGSGQEDGNKLLKLRCQVVRGTSIVLSVTSIVEACTSTSCDDGVFLDAHSQRIVSSNGDDRFSVHCSLSSDAHTELLIDHIQLDMIAL